MTLFKRANSIAGWLCFAIAAVTYLLTIEPSASLWDCGEFISTGYKLEVGHAPGNAIFSLLTRFFGMLAFGNLAMVPVMANIMSALCSAFTILFLFWTITHLGRKLVVLNSNDFTLARTIAVLGAGVIGALAFTFSDTFWFSAVEGEVYAMSSLSTAILFWAILKWEDRADEPYANRWIILIGLLLGLSIGVHLLNLLTIPAIALVYYNKKYSVHSTWGTIGVFILSCCIVGVTMFIIPTIPIILSWFELLFVNTMHLPYNSGAVVGFFIIMGLLFWACYATMKRRAQLLNTIVLFFTLFIIGFSSYAYIVIRSSANPPINENAPDNMFSLIYYLNRAQFGAPPLIYGRTYTSEVDRYKDENTYVKKNGCYEKAEKAGYKGVKSAKAVYDHKNDMLFSRLYDSGSFDDYKNWVDDLVSPKIKPTPAQNMKYLFRYQLDWMYLRYFFWNFAGRQNDVQGYGGPMYGNWVSGIKPLDNARIDGLSDQPDFLKNNRANNHYYLIPFLLGIIGFGYQLMRNHRQWWVVAVLFFFTGVAIVLYLNQTPGQPRERDYAYAGSFYVYAIWIGLAVLAFYQLLGKKMKSVAAASLAIVICAPAPILMGQQNWDDHDRSNRFIAHDIAYNYLMSCEPNAILFTAGDNDTFPLWYMQEVEGVRTDVRVVCLSLLAADWYIDQMRVKTYQSEPLPITFSRDVYLGELNNGTVPILERVDQPVDLKWMLDDFIANPKNKADFGVSEQLSYFPSRKASIPVDKSAALASGIVKEKDLSLVVDTVHFNIQGNYLGKAQLLVLEIIANNGWKRPIYFTSINGDANLGFKDYLQYNGFSYKLEPIKTAGGSNDLRIGRKDSEWLYNYLMNTCRWGNMNDPKVYIDHFYMTTLARILDVRGMFAGLSLQLLEEGKPDKAKEVLARITELMPKENFPYCMGYYPSDLAMPNIVKILYDTEQADKAKALTAELMDELQQNLSYFLSISGDPILEAQVTVVTIQDLWRIAKTYGDKDAEERLGAILRSLRIIS